MAEGVSRGILKERLPDWYRGVSVDLTGELLEARKAAIEAIAADLDVKTAPGIVAYAHGRRSSVASEFVEWINKRAVEHDPSFNAKPRDLEPRVMVACAIAHRLATTPTQETSTVLSLLALNARFCGFRSTAKTQDLPGLAKMQLEAGAERAKGVIEASTRTLIKKFNASFPDDGVAPEWDGSPIGGDAVSQWLVPAVATIKEMAGRVDSLERSFARHSEVSREELDQVAWLLDDFCELADKPWNTIKVGAPLLAGAELAAITKVPAVEASAVMVRSALLKAGSDPKLDAKPIEAVANSAKHLDLWPGGFGHQLLPLSAAIDAWREKGRGGSGWRTRAGELRSGTAVPKADGGALADQAYREFLIATRLAAHA